MWVFMELVAMATDLAEFLGAALGFNLLLGVPLWIAGLITVVVTFLLLALQSRGFRPLELVITAMLGVIALCYVIETVLEKPDWRMSSITPSCPSSSGRRACSWRAASSAPRSCPM